MAAYNGPMRILIANDDGYLAPGLAALVRACAGLGEIDVVAPERKASGTSKTSATSPACGVTVKPGRSSPTTGTTR